MIKDMLVNENRFLSFLSCIFLFGCSEDNLRTNKYIKDNFKSYSEIYKTIDDSIKVYSDSLLYSFATTLGETRQIDSMICINSKQDKLFTVLLNSSGIGKYGTSDACSEFLGKKINGKWYFFPGGGTMIIPRNMYGKDEMHPLSFYELSQIARKNMMESALVKKDGEYVVSDEWIDKKFYSTGYGLFKTRAEYDCVHWMLITRKWTEKIDTNEYKPLKKKELIQVN